MGGISHLMRLPYLKGSMMGMNFYAITVCDNPCKHCKPERLHVGKRSGGWTFVFKANDNLGLTTRREWQMYLRRPDIVIADQYGRQYTPDEFDARVDKTREPWGLNRTEPRSRCGLDERIYSDPEGWDFWSSEFL